MRLILPLIAICALLIAGCARQEVFESREDLETRRSTQLNTEEFEWVMDTPDGQWVRWNIPGAQIILEQVVFDEAGQARIVQTLLFPSETDAAAGLVRIIDGTRAPDLRIDVYRRDRMAEVGALTPGAWVGNVSGGHLYQWTLPTGEIVVDRVTRNPAGGIASDEAGRFETDADLDEWLLDAAVDNQNLHEYRETRSDELGAQLDWSMLTRGWILYGWRTPDGTYTLDIILDETAAGVDRIREYRFDSLIQLTDWVDGQLVDRSAIWIYWHQVRHFGWLMVGTVLLISFFVLFNISRARKSKDITIRRIAGLDQIDEAVGRATETARPVLMVPGLGGLDGITVQALTIFGAIARTTARFMTPIRLLNYNAAVFAVAQKIIRDVYLSEGIPEQFDVDSVRFVSDRQFAFAAAVAGTIQRERVAATFFMGDFYAESMIFAENANMVGAIQVAATTQVTQTPFFIAACDYVLLGDEFYAASAYLGREPILLGSLVGVDWAKIMFIGFALIAVIVHSYQSLTPLDLEALPAERREMALETGQVYPNWHQETFFKAVTRATRD